MVRRALPEVVVGDAELGREIRWAHVIEMPDPDDLLKGGELVLTTGLGAGAEAAHQARWTASLIDQGVAALAVELGSSWRDVPPPVVAGCARAGVPVVAFHRPVRFIEITEAVHGAVVNAQFALLARGEEIHRRFTELILQGRGVPEIMSELCAAIGNPVVLEDAGGSLVYYVSGPPGDDLALSAWADVHRGTGEGAFAVDVRLLDSSWGRLLALALDKPIDDFDRVAVERAALAVAIDLLAKQHDEQLRARSRGAFLSELADGRVEEADARRRAEALGLSATGRGDLLPVVASWRAPGFARGRRADGITWTRLSGDLRSALSSTGFAVLLGPRDVDLLILLALGSRGYDASLPEHVADLFHGALDRHGLGPADAALAIGAPAGAVGRGRTGAAAGAALGGRGDGAPGRPLARRAPPRRRRSPARPARFARARRVRRRAARSAAGRRVPAHAGAAGDARGVPGGGRPEGGGGARAAPRAPVAVPAPAPDRGGARRLARRRGRHARPAPGDSRSTVPPRTSAIASLTVRRARRR